VIGGGALILLLTAVNENLGRPVAPAINLEPVGVLVFVSGLGYGVVTTALRGEAQLRAVQRELETARKIQRSLLPRLTPHVPGLDVAVHFVPMTAVGGDLYDFVDLGPSKTGILVADVAGHGIPAALVASMVKLAFSIAVEREDSPARVMAAVNQALCRQLEQSFVTAAYVVVDTERSTLTAANAGHPPVVVGSAKRGLAKMREHGLMLGFMPEADYVNAEIALEKGDTILLYTDGVIETRNASGEFFDGERLTRWATSADGASAAQLKDSAVADIDRWRGRLPVEDDLTLVVARYRI
jgi:serine phosphatase RsbU (regulator of sigma subunit)